MHIMHGCFRFTSLKRMIFPQASKRYKKSNHAALIGMGISYGASPCAPLILMTGYAASLPLGYAALSGAVFAVASTISPMLFMLFISGVLAGKMYKEIPGYLKWFRLGCYILLIVLFSVSLLREVNILREKRVLHYWSASMLRFVFPTLLQAAL